MKTSLTKQILFGFLFLLLLVPFLQKKFEFVEMKPLIGTFVPAEQVGFNMTNWFDGNFQKAYDTWYEENIGLRNFLIRSYNQVDYSLFNTVHGDVIEGKNGYLYQVPYLAAHAGKDFIGEAEINRRMERIKFVTERLKEKGIHVMIVFAPTKADFFADYIPSYYTHGNPDSTNYNLFSKKLKGGPVPFIDFNDYFLKIKNTSQYPLFPKQGIHWNEYGMYIVADSILKSMKQVTGYNMNELYCDGIEVSHDLGSTDYDLGGLCNILFDMKHDAMPYPILRVEQNPAKTKPNVLVIGDSFYWNIYHTEIPGKIFNGANFWYYNYQAYSDTFPDKREINFADYKGLVEKNQVILILQTVSNLNKVGFDFFENMYNQLNGNNLLATFEKQIRDNPEWLEKVTKKANERKVPVDDMIRQDAQWMVDQEMKKKP